MQCAYQINIMCPDLSRVLKNQNMLLGNKRKNLRRVRRERERVRLPKRRLPHELLLLESRHQKAKKNAPKLLHMIAQPWVQEAKGHLIAQL